jgi:major membrane immunogen (membrane-anchored lipoprotein)
MCGRLQAQRSCCGVFRGQMYHQHRLLSLLQGKALGFYRGYSHSLLRILQGKAVEVLHGADVSSAQVTELTTG